MKPGLMGISALLLAVAPAPAVAAETDWAREAEDRAQIEKVMWQYVRALDTHNAEAYAAVFAPDGQFGNIKGREALKKMIEGLRQRAADNATKSGVKAPPTYHVITNSNI